MKPKTLILMVLAIGCGLGASFMTSRLLAERQKEEQTQQEKITILVAKKNIDMGQVIKTPEDLFQDKLVLKDDAPKNAIDKMDQLKGRQLKISRRAGDFITPDDLVDGLGLQAHLPKGYRAIGLRVNLESIAGGFAALPLSRVDIISTVKRGSDKDSYSQILLENVLVLAADTQNQRDENGRAMPASVVTVALSPEEVLKVNLGKEMGVLSLALRGFGDSQRSNAPKVSVESILNGTRSRDEGEEGEEKTSTALPGLPKNQLDLSKTPSPSPAPTQVAEAPKETPKRQFGSHSLTIYEGEKERRTDYTLDEKGNVVRHDVVRSEVTAPPPAPAVTAPQAPANPVIPVPPGAAKKGN